MDKNNNNCSWVDLPTDALVQILVRLPPNERRRLRVVCQHLRELIDNRTATDMRSRTKIIAVTKTGLMTVFDLVKPGSPRCLLWQTDIDTARRYSAMSIVGVCNGLVCLCDDLTPGGAITVANPSTGEAMCLPPLPMPSSAVHLNNNGGSSRSWHQMYIFVYHHVTGRYKVVHVPCHLDPFSQPGIVHVFTLGEASWRDVHTETDARCRLDSSLTDVDDTVYWITEDDGKIMSFDLKHERVTCTDPDLEAPAAMLSAYRLTKVHGRLGIAVGDDHSVTVWVLEDERWSRRYILEVDMLRQEEKLMMRWDFEVLHLVHGNYFLTLSRESWTGYFVLYRHTMNETSRSQDGVVHIRHKDRGEEVTSFRSLICQTFPYVETKESLSVYHAVLVVHK